MRELNEFSQAAKINQQFRKQIRRKDIDRRLAQRRKQFLEYQKNMNTKQISQDNLMNNNNINAWVEQIYNNYTKNGNNLSKQDLKQLAKLSCTVAGSQIITCSSKQFFVYLLEQFVFKQGIQQSQQLDWVLFVLNNCLTVSNSNYIQTNNYNCAYMLNQLATSQKFILRIFDITLQSIKNSIKQNSMSVIFCIIYNNQPNFAKRLVTNPKYSIMSLFFNQMHTQPHKNVVMQTLRCYYLILRKLNFQSCQQFSKMRKFIILIIRNSNCLQLTMLGVVCLYSLLKSLPAERAIVSKSGILSTIVSQTLSLNNEILAINVLRLCSFYLQVKNQPDIKLVLFFIQSSLQKFSNFQLQIYGFKMFYDIICNSLYQVDMLPNNYSKLYNRTLELFESNFTNKDILIQVSYCLSLTAAKSKNMERQLTNKIINRIKDVVTNLDLEQKDINFLKQSLIILNSTQRMSQL